MRSRLMSLVAAGTHDTVQVRAAEYYTAQDPTDVQAGVFAAGEPAQITVTSNLGGQASSPVSRYYKPPY